MAVPRRAGDRAARRWPSTSQRPLHRLRTRASRGVQQQTEEPSRHAVFPRRARRPIYVARMSWSFPIEQSAHGAPYSVGRYAHREQHREPQLDHERQVAPFRLLILHQVIMPIDRAAEKAGRQCVKTTSSSSRWPIADRQIFGAAERYSCHCRRIIAWQEPPEYPSVN